MELIQKWLSGTRNFYVGAILYKKFGTDEALKKLLAGKPEPYLQKRLEDALSELLQKPKVVLQQPVAKQEAEEMPKSEDAILEALRQEWIPLYQRMNYLRHEMDRFEGNDFEIIAKRKPLAIEVLELEQQCMRVWERREYYLKNGKLPEVKEKEESIPEDPIALGKMIETLKRNIRRNKQLAEAHPDKTIYPLKVKQYEEQLQQILSKLKTDEGTKK